MSRVQDALVRERHDQGLEQLYREDGGRLWRAILAYSGDREVANDAVAEAFAQALRRGDAIHRPQAWVWRAAFRIAAGEMANRARFIRAHQNSPPAVHAEPLEDPSGILMTALRKLSPKQRGALILYHYAGYPVLDVARILGSTSGAVRVHLSKGRRRLRELLGEDRE
jgi:RNA polymerase sigma-70 factor (ECF subfamily)